MTEGVPSGSAVRRIPLDRRVCVIREGRIDLRPERGAIVGPLIGLVIGAGLFVAIGLFANDLPALALMAMLIPGIIIAPFSAMGLVYSLVGASVVIEAAKQSVRFQQGLLGLGIGTAELVPFWKVDRFELEDFETGEESRAGPRTPVDIRGWDIILVKQSGKRLWVAQVLTASAPDLVDEAFARAHEAAEVMAAMTGHPLVITAALEEEGALEPWREAAPGRTEQAES
jgi:hypothetical protein